MNYFHEKLRQELEKVQPSIIETVLCIIGRGHELRASDIHIDPTEKALQVRYRIDGLLQNGYEISKYLHASVISRIKVLANLRTDDHQTPKDGRFRVNVKEELLNIRVSLIPTYHGENAILRLLPEKFNFSLTELGFSEKDQSILKEIIYQPYGLVIITGPTGSGKTTTLYTLLKMLEHRNLSIITIEDPIEFALDGIRQIQINPASGLTFTAGLRSILRQDPNVIMIGEIRDSDTASLAIHAALTGHLVITTLHTNSATAAHARLIDMKVPPYLIASTLNAVIGQRLVRKKCLACRAENNSAQIKEGCPACNNTGFSGRLALYEIFKVTKDVRNILSKKISSQALEMLAEERDMIPLRKKGKEIVEAGLTTVPEILNALYE